MPNPENIIPHQFKKGKSGNPAGRAKGVRTRQSIVREMLELTTKVKNPISGKEEVMPLLEQMVIAVIAKAKKATSQHLKS